MGRIGEGTQLRVHGDEMKGHLMGWCQLHVQVVAHSLFGHIAYIEFIIINV